MLIPPLSRKNDSYAFFINAYNALAIHMITANACEKDLFGACGNIGSITDIGTIIPYRPVWGMTAGTLAGNSYSLDDVEGYLRNPTPYSEDPRLHAAIVCASISCANLRPEAYVAERIDYQLTDNFNSFINNTGKGMDVDETDNMVHLNMVFKWYESDFIDYMKNTDSTVEVLEYILIYMYQSDPRFNWLRLNKGTVTIHYFDYNWDVNAEDGVPCSCQQRPCYPLWALLVTLGSLVFAVIIVAVVVVCVRRRRARAGYERINEDDK